MLVRKTFHPEDHKFDVWSTDEWPPKDPLGIYERTYLYCAHGRKQNEENRFFFFYSFRLLKKERNPLPFPEINNFQIFSTT